jgi:hypothetical protein
LGDGGRPSLFLMDIPQDQSQQMTICLNDCELRGERFIDECLQSYDRKHKFRSQLSEMSSSKKKNYILFISRPSSTKNYTQLLTYSFFN